MRLESLPKMKRLVQSDITNILVRQLTSLLNEKKENILVPAAKLNAQGYEIWSSHKDMHPRRVSSPCIHRIPKPLRAVANWNPITRKLCCRLFSSQWSKLAQMPVSGTRITTKQMSMTLITAQETCSYHSYTRSRIEKSLSLSGIQVEICNFKYINGQIKRPLQWPDFDKNSEQTVFSSLKKKKREKKDGKGLLSITKYRL